MKKNVAIILGSGGHTTQILRLVDKMGKKYDYTYIIANTDSTSEKHIRIKGSVHYVYDTRLKTDKNLIKIILKFIPSTIETIKILNKIKPDFIIGCGPGMNLHVLWIAKYLFRAKLIFFESWVRVYNKSLTGRLIYPFSDLFMVQWRTMIKKYPKAVFVGRLG
jgi:beta-1,4-N-acetylglucosaminyltransferase